MSICILSKKRQFFKKLRQTITLPDPLQSFDGFVKLKNADLYEMDRMELRRAWNEAEFQLLLLGDDDFVFHMDAQGNLFTARAYLLKRIALIRQLWRKGGTA